MKQRKYTTEIPWWEEGLSQQEGRGQLRGQPGAEGLLIVVGRSRSSSSRSPVLQGQSLVAPMNVAGGRGSGRPASGGGRQWWPQPRQGGMRGCT